MPPYKWDADPTSLIRTFEARHNSPAAGALLLWAAWSVDSLHYLEDIDAEFAAAAPAGHSPDIVDVSHARWATGTSMTALDLCAAALGRAFVLHTGHRELAIAHYERGEDPPKRTVERRRALPDPARKWIDDLCIDPMYRMIKNARDSLTHSRVTRHLSHGPEGRRRIELALIQGPTDVREVIHTSRDLATSQVERFYSLLTVL
jgi:hypothetical protein